MAYVYALENKDNRGRREVVLSVLQGLGVRPILQECRWLKISNIVVDFASPPPDRKLLFSAHYDTFRDSPGANDNASGVAVLLGLCRKLRGQQAPVRVVFFDREEAWLRTPFLRLGVLGSLVYVIKNDLREIAAVYSVEFSGLGDFLGIWPVSRKEANLTVVKRVEKAATDLSILFQSIHIPWQFLSSDHLPFRWKGLPDALTLSLVPASRVPALETLLTQLSLRKILAGWRPKLPEPLSFIHMPEDTSSRLKESSLQLMLSLLLKLVELA